MKQIYIRFLSPALVVLFLLAACSKDKGPEPTPAPEYLISSENVTNVSAGDIKALDPQLAPFIANGVKVYRIVYKTDFPEGNEIQASGLIIVPDNDKDQFTMLSFQHGTITTQEEAPSAYQPVGNMEAYLAGTVGAALAKPYLVVMPDYIGYGVSSDLAHPYIDKASLASASLDMLRAAKEFAKANEINVKKEIRLLGYSEGGYATMALHQAIQETAANEFTVEASYPGAGTYDVVGTAKWVLSQNTDMPAMAASFYMWTLLTYNQLYGINAPLTELLTPDNAVKVGAAIASGNLMEADVSDNPTELFAPAFIQGILNETNAPFMNALRANNVYDWKPNSPVILFHSSGDDIVPVLNAENAESAMKSKGADVKFVSLGVYNHRQAIQLYIAAVLQELMK